MRITRLIVPIVLSSAVLAGCATPGQQGTTPPAAPSSAAPVGNGVESLAADAILAKAIAAVDAAGSFRMKGSIDGGDGKLTMDFKVKGDDTSGTLTMAGGTMTLLKIGEKIFVQGDDEFWRAFGGDAAATHFKGKWVKAGANSPEFAAFAAMADVEQMFKPEGTITKADVKTINGVRAVGLSDQGNGTLYVAIEGEPYPVRLEAPDGSGAMDFSEFGISVDEIKEPAAKDVVDVKALAGQ